MLLLDLADIVVKFLVDERGSNVDGVCNFYKFLFGRTEGVSDLVFDLPDSEILKVVFHELLWFNNIIIWRSTLLLGNKCQKA